VLKSDFATGRGVKVMGSAIRSTHFSTREVAAADQFDAWRDMISVIFDVTRIGGQGAMSFAATVDAYQIGKIVVTSSRQSEQAYSLSPKRIRREDLDLFQVGYYRCGGYRGDANGRSIAGQAGAIQVLDLAQPMQSVEPASAIVCIFFSREILECRIGNIAELHGIDLPDDLSRLLADYIDLLADRLPQMPEDEADQAADETIEMIASCLRPTAATMRKAKSQMQKVLLLRAKRKIEENLRSPGLNPEYLSRTLSVSRRSLYRLFEPLGGVHQYILSRRLNAIMAALRAENGSRRIADLAAQYGFTCQETFWRAFRRQFDLTPGEARSLALSYSGANPRHAEAGFDQWLRQLSA